MFQPEFGGDRNTYSALVLVVVAAGAAGGLSEAYNACCLENA